MVRRAVVPAFVASVVGCALSTADAPPEDVARTTEAVGEPMNGFPSADERLMIMAINRGRSDPSTIKGPMSTVYPARPPVAWSYDLSRSSRFHATNLFDADVTLMHTSPCTLNTDVGTSGCDGSIACACATPVPTMCASCAMQDAENSCGTAPFTRIGYFTSIANGEVAAAGYSDTFASVNGWLDEPAGSDGHRTNLLDQGITSNTMGAGHIAGKGACYSSFDISDSGMQKGLTIPQMPTGSIQPVTGSTTTMFTFYATWADATGGAPQGLDVVVDNICIPLTLELGMPTLNSTWSVGKTLSAGCHSYYYVATDSKGNTVLYPTTGSLGVTVTPNTTDEPACAADYDATPTTVTCPVSDAGIAMAADGGGGTKTGGDGGSGGGSGATGASGSGASGAGASGTASGSGGSVAGGSGASGAGASGTASGATASGAGSGTTGAASGTAGTGGAGSGATGASGTAGAGTSGGTALKGDAGTGGGGGSPSQGCSVSAVATRTNGSGSLVATPLLFALVALRRRKSARTPAPT
jgi:hypothetical protein